VREEGRTQGVHKVWRGGVTEKLGYLIIGGDICENVY